MPFWRKDKGPSRIELLSEARAYLEAGRVEESIERYERYVDAHADDLTGWAEYARALVKGDRSEEALAITNELDPSAPLVLLAHGEALAAMGKPEEALEVLAKAREWYELELGRNYGAQYARVGHREASQLFDAVYAELHGHEQVVVEHAKRATLDARSGVNYRLLGDSLMVGSQHRPVTIDLESIDEMQDRLDDMARKDREAMDGLLLAGTIALRTDRASRAVEIFEKATALDGSHFAAFRGLGAAMDFANRSPFDTVKSLYLPDARGWSGFEEVIADLDYLTDAERKIVIASIAPLRHALPVLAASERAIRIMPLDARTTDYPEFSDAEGMRFDDDHRSLCAISGVAGSHLALVRLDELLDVDRDKGWVFAHEFAHLAHRVMTDEYAERVFRCFERASRAGYIGSEYSRKNEFEFFAVYYTDVVMERNGLRRTHARDDLGVADEMDAIVDAMDRDPDAFAEMRQEDGK